MMRRFRAAVLLLVPVMLLLAGLIAIRQTSVRQTGAPKSWVQNVKQSVIGSNIMGDSGGWNQLQGPMAPRPMGSMVRARGGVAPPFNTEAYDHIADNGWKRTTTEPLSTFSIDVDTASYANTRRFIHDGQRPPADAVRIEELINYFTYDYPQPDGDAPFSVTTEVGVCPWRPDHRLALIGLQGRTLTPGQI